MTFVKIGNASNYNPLKNPLCKNSVWSSSSQLSEDAAWLYVTFRSELVMIVVKKGIFWRGRVVDFPKDFRSREREFPEISPGIPGNSREL